jgi:PAS domain S-box-containing protein
MNIQSSAKESTVIRMIIMITGGLSALAGAITLIFWFIGEGYLTSVLTGLKPMSPGTALFSFVFGLTCLTGAYSVAGEKKKFVSGTIFFFSAYSLLTVLGYFIKTDLTFNGVFFQFNNIHSSLEDIQSSPVSSFLFFLTGLGITFRMYRPESVKLMNITGSIGIICFIVGMTILRSYVVGDPFFYSLATIPLSIPTAVVILLLGMGLLVMGGKDSYYIRPFYGTSGSSRLLKYTIPVIFLVLLADDFLHSALSDLQLHFYILLSSFVTILLLIVCIWLIIISTRNVFRQAELATEKLKQSEERYQALVEWSPYAALVHRDMKILYVNPAAVKLFGATSEQDLIGTPVMRWHHPDYHQIVLDRIRKAYEEGIAAPMIESKYFKLDGTVMDLEVQGKPIIYDGLTSILATFNDVTERRRSETAMMQLQSRYSSLISNISDVIAIISVEGIIKYKSPNVEKWFGWVPEDSVGKNNLEFIHPDDISLVHEKFIALLKDEGSVLTFEFRYKCKDGSYKPVEITANSLLNYPEINGILVNYRDISERKRVEQERAAQSALITSLFDSIPEIIFFKDFNGVYLGCNPAFAEMLLMTRDEIIGKTDFDFIDREIADLYRRRDLEIMNHRLTRHDEEWFTYPDGHKALIDTLKTPYLAIDGSLIGILAISRDITRQKNNETGLIKAIEEAKEASRAKSIFLANMSHEIRTPLNSIIGFAQLMNREILTDSQKKYIISIHRSGEHLLKLLNDILDLSKIEAGRLELNPLNTDLYGLFSETNAIFSEQASSKQLRLIFEIHADVPRYVIIDSGKLRQILINLIGNAIKFTNEGGIAVRACVRQVNDLESTLMVEIQDSGVGISEKEMGRLFQQFEQGSAGIKQVSGSGLGLALSRELANLMGGDITANSVEGKGSTFTFTVGIKQGKHEIKEATITNVLLVLMILRGHTGYWSLTIWKKTCWWPSIFFIWPGSKPKPQLMGKMHLINLSTGYRISF